MTTTGQVPEQAASVVSVGDVRVVPLAEWDDLMTSLGALDTYTRAAHHRACALLETPGTRPVLLHFRHRAGELALPLLLRPLPGRMGWDAITPYGYGGPVGFGEAALAFGVAKLVHDPAVYAELAGTDSTAGFFPPWRAG